MDIAMSFQPTPLFNGNGSLPKGGDMPLPKVREQQDDPALVKVQPVEDGGGDVDAGDEQRLAALREAIARSMRDAYPVGDRSFTIFKDATTGQFITRFTSLRDGSVTYVPEPEIFKMTGGANAFDMVA